MPTGQDDCSPEYYIGWTCTWKLKVLGTNRGIACNHYAIWFTESVVLIRACILLHKPRSWHVACLWMCSWPHFSGWYLSQWSRRRWQSSEHNSCSQVTGRYSDVECIWTLSMFCFRPLISSLDSWHLVDQVQNSCWVFFPVSVKGHSNRERFYRAAWNATRSYDEISVCLSVCLSVCPSDVWIVIKWKKNQSRFLYHAKEHSL